LLDEPFSQIDTFRKNVLCRNLFSYLKEKQITCIIATQDSAEALSFSGEIIVLKEGELLVKTISAILYKNPKNRYIASLFVEVYELRLSQLIENYQEDKILLLYPHQLKVVKNGFLKVIVKHSYFKGSIF
jgi:ABC-type proline/glycine betaine transport system ATPase subunit